MSFKVGDIVKIIRGVSTVSNRAAGRYSTIVHVATNGLQTREYAVLSIEPPTGNITGVWIDEIELADLSPLETLLLVDE